MGTQPNSTLENKLTTLGSVTTCRVSNRFWKQYGKQKLPVASGFLFHLLLVIFTPILTKLGHLLSWKETDVNMTRIKTAQNTPTSALYASLCFMKSLGAAACAKERYHTIWQGESQRKLPIWKKRLQYLPQSCSEQSDEQTAPILFGPVAATSQRVNNQRRGIEKREHQEVVPAVWSEGRCDDERRADDGWVVFSWRPSEAGLQGRRTDDASYITNQLPHSHHIIPLYTWRN